VAQHGRLPEEAAVHAVGHLAARQQLRPARDGILGHFLDRLQTARIGHRAHLYAVLAPAPILREDAISAKRLANAS
jgi:hypothetical protein